MSRVLLFLSVLSVLVVSSCIKDDFVEDFVQPQIRISSVIDTLGVDSIFTVNATFFNNVGANEEVNFDWTSSDESIITVSNEGVARGVSEGDAMITASYLDPATNEEIASTVNFTVGKAILPPPMMDPLQVKEGIIETTTFYALTGDFTFSETEDGGIDIDIASNYRADTRLPGLYIYLSNNKNSIANAREISEVTTFNGAHSYNVPNVGFDDYSFIVYFCKPFNVKVGEATL